MGAQLSADGASPGVSSLGSNGQKGGATPRSASERSLALSSSGASSSVHSIRLRTFSGNCSAASLPPPLMLSSYGQTKNAFSPPSSRDEREGIDCYVQCHCYDAQQSAAFLHNDRGRSAKSQRSPPSRGLQYPHGAFFRWQSFTKTLPSLMMQANNTQGNVAARDCGSENNCTCNEKEHQQRQWHRREVVDANNNNNETVPDSAFPVSFMSSSASYDAQKQKQMHFPHSADRNVRVEHKEPPNATHQQQNKKRSNFSLKSSLRKSGSRFFSSIVRNGYLRSLLSDEESSSTSDEEEEEEHKEWRGDTGWRRDWWTEEAAQCGAWQCNGNGGADNNANMHSILSSTTSNPSNDDNNNNNNSRGIGPRSVANGGPPAARRPPQIQSDSPLSSSAWLLQQQQQKQPPLQKSHLPTKSLRFSLKRHLMGQQKTTVGSVDGKRAQPNAGNNSGTVSSVLLAMAAGKKTMRDFLSEPTNKTAPALVDWNGNGYTAADECQLSIHWHEDQMSRKKIIHASSAELMRALGAFIEMRCDRLTPQFEPVQLTNWLRSVDRALILQGWQDVAFINPANLVFLFMLIRDSFTLGECVRLRSLDELHSFVLLCLYISYSYMGNEISYPLKPFITEQTNRANFWSQCVKLVKCHSVQMLRLNSSSAFFLEVFTELKRYSTGADDY